MQLVFTKGSGKYDRMDIVRPGLPAQSVDCPKQGIIPHDMVHYAVESTLQKRGFIARLSSGEAAGQRMAEEAESDAVERLVEVFQADGWAGWGSAAQDMIDLYRVTCSARACPMLPIDGAAIEAVRQCLLELTAQWQAVPVGRALTLAF
ncbi:hypothetical protein [Dyella sp. ASV21]|uniref:hypothetical protein n=1 Tax=Dyella sp. ASV21 TaxID=2795114 RepID=UPI0018EBA5B6|nr:hypothetical protein [Dyella sp. ASV21]